MAAIGSVLETKKINSVLKTKKINKNEPGIPNQEFHIDHNWERNTGAQA